MVLRAAVIGGLSSALALIAASPAAAKPCAEHAGTAKKQCLKVKHEREARDKLRFPPAPVTRRDVEVRVPDWQGFVRLGRCEQPGPSKYGDGVNWGHQGPTWGGGVGLYRGTWHAAGSPYRVFSGSKWETILVSDAIRDRFGITAWGAWRCF
jgi:hypothetical protein